MPSILMSTKRMSKRVSLSRSRAASPLGRRFDVMAVPFEPAGQGFAHDQFIVHNEDLGAVMVPPGGRLQPA